MCFDKFENMADVLDQVSKTSDSLSEESLVAFKEAQRAIDKIFKKHHFDSKKKDFLVD